MLLIANPVTKNRRPRGAGAGGFRVAPQTIKIIYLFIIESIDMQGRAKYKKYFPYIDI
jgi:hypothetical protein